MEMKATLKNALHFFGGVLLVLLGHLFFMGLVLLGIWIRGRYQPLPMGDYWEVGVLVIALTGIGFFQVIYVVPLSLYLKRLSNKKLLLQGVLITAALTLLCSGICGSMFYL